MSANKSLDSSLRSAMRLQVCQQACHEPSPDRLSERAMASLRWCHVSLPEKWRMVMRLMFWSAGGRHGEAYYVPSKDFISLPAFAAFKNADSLGLAEFERDLVATITRIRNSERLNGCGLR